VDSSRLRQFAIRALESVGMPTDHAELAANAMAWSELRGLEAHGVSRRLLQCVGRVRGGGTKAAARIDVPSPDIAFATIDGANALGLVGASLAMMSAIERARQHGIGFVVVRDVSSLAALGYYPHMAVEANMVGIAVTNGPRLVAPPGGVRPTLGNAAHAFGCPAGKHPPILFDSAVTAMSTGEIEKYHARGELLPEGVLRDSNGEPTQDPDVWRTGILETIGGYRGFGLALAFETLTGLLGGSSRYGDSVIHPFELTQAQGVTATCIAVDPARSLPLADFTSRVDEVIDQVHGAGRPGKPTPRVPGERSHAISVERRRDGIPLSADAVAALDTLAAELSIDPL
jgi:LDH2 family malate/lactate/ureidoglycolate dehydrogenase